MDVTIIIVNYNTKELLKECLQSVYKETQGIAFEVIVSDNGSLDGSVEMIKQDFPQVILIENNANLGFGAANNRALAIAKGKYIFYLNSDTILLNNAVKIFFDVWEKSEDKNSLGALGCILQNENGQVIHSGAPFPTYKFILKILIKMGFYESCLKQLIKRFHKPHVDTYLSGKYDGYVTGADLFLLNNDFAKYDERFFMYFEETDLQYNNFYKRNLTIMLLDEPKIIHLVGGSSQEKNITKFAKQTNFYNWISAIKYLRKNKLASSFQIGFLKIVLEIIYLFHFSKCKRFMHKIFIA